jgi:hypothetical protein
LADRVSGAARHSVVFSTSELSEFGIIPRGRESYIAEVDDGNQTDGPPDTGTIRKSGWSTKTGVLTMNTTKTLMLAAATALTLGAGAAMAQSQVPSGAEGAYMSQQRPAAPKTANNTWGRFEARVQAGASDIEHAHVGHALPFNGDYGDLANPG